MKNNYKESFEQMRIAGYLAAKTLDEITSYVTPVISTKKIDKIWYEFIRENGGYSAPLFYRGFPKSCCTSVNHVVCHGIPTEKYLKEGDTINIDVTAIIKGWHGDTSRMYYVGDVSVKSKKLVSTTYESMMKAISIIRSGIKLDRLDLLGRRPEVMRVTRKNNRPGKLVSAITLSGYIRFWLFWHRLKALDLSFQTVPKSSKSDISRQSYGRNEFFRDGGSLV